MADYITPEEVPSAGSLENILGFDAADKWAKMPGSTLAKASDLAVTDGKATAAQSAAAAAEAKAESAEALANQAVAETRPVTNNVNNLMGFQREVYTIELMEPHDYSISALWFCNGLASPTGKDFPENQTGAYNTVICSPGYYADVKLRIKAANAIPNGNIAELTFVGACSKLTLYQNNTEIGYFTHTQGYMVFRLKFNDGLYYISGLAGGVFTKADNSIYVICEPTAGNGTITITQGGTTKGSFSTNQGEDQTIELEAGGGSITVDSALSDTSENPVQNKVVNAALGEKLSKYGHALSLLNQSTLLWRANEEAFLYTSSADLSIDARPLLTKVPIGSSVAGYLYLGARKDNITVGVVVDTGKKPLLTFTGLTAATMYLISIRIMKTGTSSFALLYTIQECNATNV